MNEISPHGKSYLSMSNVESIESIFLQNFNHLERTSESIETYDNLLINSGDCITRFRLKIEASSWYFYSLDKVEFYWTLWNTKSSYCPSVLQNIYDYFDSSIIFWPVLAETKLIVSLNLTQTMFSIFVGLVSLIWTYRTVPRSEKLSDSLHIPSLSHVRRSVTTFLLSTACGTNKIVQR